MGGSAGHWSGIRRQENGRFYTVDSMPYASTRAGGKPGGTHTWMTHTETIKKLFRLLDDGETLYAIHSK